MPNQVIESAENQSRRRQSNETSEKAPQAVAKAKNSATRFSEHAVLIVFSHLKKKVYVFVSKRQNTDFTVRSLKVKNYSMPFCKRSSLMQS
jgi:hypothetical protein